MRIGVLGLGFMGSTHLAGLVKIPGVELAAVCSDDESKLTGDLSSVQGNIGGPGQKYDFSNIGRYTRWEDAVADPRVEAVDICLPTHLHAPAALKALELGKHVLVEKPMALDGAQAREIVAEARRRGLTLMAAQVLRFFPMYQLLRSSLASLGTVRSALFRRRCAAPFWSQWLADPKQSGGGVFDLLIHDVDICVQLFGRPESVRATGHENLARGIDTIFAEFQYAGLGPVVITGGWHHPESYPFSMEYTVVADGGTLEYNSAGRPPTLHHADGRGEALPMTETDGYQAEVAYFAGCVMNGRPPVICPPEESALAVELTRRMLDSRARNGETIPCNQ